MNENITSLVSAATNEFNEAVAIVTKGGRLSEAEAAKAKANLSHCVRHLEAAIKAAKKL